MADKLIEEAKAADQAADALDKAAAGVRQVEEEEAKLQQTLQQESDTADQELQAKMRQEARQKAQGAMKKLAETTQFWGQAMMGAGVAVTALGSGLRQLGLEE